ncbi:MAG: LeuD/DmdB family oxidoreductase small subunit, partial [Syntrophales bacterium]
LVSSDPAFLAAHCMEDADPEFVKKISAGDIIVAGENFGCGSSREHAPIAIKTAGISCVVAKSFARIFYRNAFNIGLPIFESKDLWDLVSDGQEIEVYGDDGSIKILDSDRGPLRIEPIPPFMQELVSDGGLMKHIAKKKA